MPDFADRYHPDPNAAQLLERGVRWPGCHDGAPAPTGAALGLLELAARGARLEGRSVSWELYSWAIVALYAVLVVRASLRHRAGVRRLHELLAALREEETRGR